jgi:uncharacterized protein YabE (DUF348 family)
MILEPPITADDTHPSQPRPPYRRIRGYHPYGLVLFLLLLVIVLLLLLGFIWRVVTMPLVLPVPTQTITLVINGEQRSLRTPASTVNDLLLEQGITLMPDDMIAPAIQTPLSEGMVITLNPARTVTLTLNDTVQTIRTPFTTPYDILQEAGITLTEKDRLWLDGTETDAAGLLMWAIPVLDITLKRAVTVTIFDNGAEIPFTTAAGTVGEALYEAGITLYLTDIITPEVQTPVIENQQIRIQRAMPITIRADDATLVTRITVGATVADALAQMGVILVGLDYVLPTEETPVTPDMVLQVIRVREELQTQDEPVPFETVFQADATLELDTRVVRHSGTDGVRQILMRVRFENGVETGRDYAGEEIVTPPQNRLIAYGTNIVLRTIETPEGARDYWRKLRVYATSYKPAALGGDDRTALGMKLEKGMIAADPDIIPWRTNLYVPDYGFGIMGDTGGPRRSPYWVDLGYSDADYVSWHQFVEVYLLTPVPENIDYFLPEQ